MFKTLDKDNYKADELKALCTMYGITDFSEASNPSKPSKEVMVSLLNKYYIENKVEGVDETIKANVDSEDPLAELPETLGNQNLNKVIPTDSLEKVVLTKTAQRRIQKDELSVMHSAIVTLASKSVTQSILTESGEASEENEVIYITWGNDLIGHIRTKVVLGVPWQYPLGCLNNLKAAMFSTQRKIKNTYVTVESKKYIVDDLPPLSETQLTELQEQKKYIDSQLKINNSLGM